MTPVKFATLTRYYAGANSSTLTDADLLVLANAFKDEIAADITKANEDYFGMLLYRDLEAGVREYSLPDDVLNQIKYVEIMLDGSEWKHMDEFDINSYKRATDETSIIAQFSGKNPAYDIFRRSLWIYSDVAIAAVTEGLKLWAILYPEDITDLTSTTDMSVDPTTTRLGFPRQFHELLARRVSIAYKTGRDKPIPLSEKEQLYEVDLKAAIDAIKGGNLDRSTVATSKRDTGQDY